MWTEAAADADLTGRLADLELKLWALARVPLTAQQLAALMSLVYNIGLGAFENSTLLKLLRQSDYHGAADQFLRWNKATVNGQKVVVAGLVSRRERERAVFLQGTVGVTT